MNLKRWDAVEWLELPKIEHPSHARYMLERLVNINGIGVSWLQGLPDVIWNDTEYHRRGILDEHSHEVLMKRVEQAEIFLIYDANLDPAFPLLRRGNGADSDKWFIADDTIDHFVRDRIEWMLSNAIENKGF